MATLDTSRKQVPPQTTLAKQTPTPGQLAQLLIERDNFPVEQLEALMRMQAEYEARQARQAFAEAIVQFRAQCPTIKRTGKASFEGRGGSGHVMYTYAQLPQAMEQIQSLMDQCGLAVTWTTPSQTKDYIEVTCTVTHVAGHSECTKLGGPPDTSGAKNALQAIKSTWTYLRRVTLFSLLGLVDKDEIDDDGAGGKGVTPPKSVTDLDKAEQAAKAAFREVCLEKIGQPTIPAKVLWGLLSEAQTLSGLQDTQACAEWLQTQGVFWDGTSARIIPPPPPPPPVEPQEAKKSDREKQKELIEICFTLADARQMVVSADYKTYGLTDALETDRLELAKYNCIQFSTFIARDNSVVQGRGASELKGPSLNIALHKAHEVMRQLENGPPQP